MGSRFVFTLPVATEALCRQMNLGDGANGASGPTSSMGTPVESRRQSSEGPSKKASNEPSPSMRARPGPDGWITPPVRCS